MIFSAVDMRVSNMVEAWKVIPDLLSILILTISSVRRYRLERSSELLHQDFRITTKLKT